MSLPVQKQLYSPLNLALKYFRYCVTASNGKGHGIHSPFVFELITKVLNDSTHYEAYQVVENLRDKLRNDTREIKVDDFGAGSSVSNSEMRKVSTIAKSAAKPKKLGQLLFRIVRYYQPKTIIELGTSLGITSSYLSLAQPAAAMKTMEGAPEIASIARQNFEALNLKNIEIVVGNFDYTLAEVLKKTDRLDFAFIDGNHRQLPTENYFNQLLENTHHDSLLIFDDIHWSREMEAAWETIKNHPSVKCTVDLFFIGLVFFRQEFREKQHFTIRF